jgi:hypothetical protein
MKDRNMSLETATWLYYLLMIVSIVLGVWFALRK